VLSAKKKNLSSGLGGGGDLRRKKGTTKGETDYLGPTKNGSKARCLLNFKRGGTSGHPKLKSEPQVAGKLIKKGSGNSRRTGERKNNRRSRSKISLTKEIGFTGALAGREDGEVKNKNRAMRWQAEEEGSKKGIPTGRKRKSHLRAASGEGSPETLGGQTISG